MSMSSFLSIRFGEKDFRVYAALKRYTENDKDITINRFVIAAIEEKMYRAMDKESYAKTDLTPEENAKIEQLIKDKKFKTRTHFFSSAAKKYLEGL